MGETMPPDGQMKTDGPSVVIVGLDTIAKAVGAGRGAVRRWILEENFPAKRCTDGVYRADPEAVRRWFSTPPFFRTLEGEVLSTTPQRPAGKTAGRKRA